MAVRLQLSEVATGSTYDAITASDVGNLLSILPPLLEQRAIADYLDWETKKLDALAAKIHEAIDRLRELLSALISRAVTGRIGVREAAA